MNEPYENNNNPFPWDSDSTYHYTKPKKEKKAWTGGKVIVIALICSLLGGLFGAGGMLLGSGLLTADTPVQPQENVSNLLEGNRENISLNINQVNTEKLMTPAEVYAANVNSTVGITTSITTNYWGYPTTSAASGSTMRWFLFFGSF